LVAFIEGLSDLLTRGLATFEKTPLQAYLGTGRDKQFTRGFGKHNRSNVPPIQDSAAIRWGDGMAKVPL
jgi:hypothetical protein